MNRDADKKRELLTGWWSGYLPTYSVRLFDRSARFDLAVARTRLAGLPAAPSVYVLFATAADGTAPVYIGKAENPVVRWAQHLDGWQKGARGYGRWRAALLDPDDRALADLTLLVVPVADVRTPPIPGFPVTLGALEYQLVGLAADAFPGRLLNSEGKARC